MLDTELSESAKIVAYWMAEHQNRSSGLAWPSVATLMALTGFAERTVQGARAALVMQGWLDRPSAPPGRSNTPRYSFTAKKVRPIAPKHEGIAIARQVYGLSAKGVHTAAPGGAATDTGGCKPANDNGAASRTQPSREPSCKPSSSSPSVGDGDDDILVVVRAFIKGVKGFWGKPPGQPINFMKADAKHLLSIARGDVGLVLTSIAEGLEALHLQDKGHPSVLRFCEQSLGGATRGQ
jgi:hypothetical protein